MKRDVLEMSCCPIIVLGFHWRATLAAIGPIKLTTINIDRLYEYVSLPNLSIDSSKDIVRVTRFFTNSDIAFFPEYRCRAI